MKQIVSFMMVMALGLGMNGAGLQASDLISQDERLDAITPDIVQFRNDGQYEAALELMFDLAARATPFEASVLALWMADDVYRLAGIQSAANCLNDLLMDTKQGTYMGRSWRCWALLRMADFCADSGNVSQAASYLRTAALEYPNELNPFSYLEESAVYQTTHSTDALGPDAIPSDVLLQPDSAHVVYSLTKQLGYSLIINENDETLLNKIDASGFADQVEIGPFGGNLATISKSDAEQLIASINSFQSVHYTGTLNAAGSLSLPCYIIQGSWQTSGDRTFLIAIQNSKITHIIGLDWMYAQESAVRADATSGFQRPAQYDHAGYCFLEWSSSSGCVHPGLDINGPGGCNDDLGKPIWAIANGTVRGVNATNWGNIVIEHRWRGTTSYSQYGHMRTVSVSVGMNVSKGQQIGTMGNRGTTCAHLHTEIRHIGPYHPDVLNPSYWNNTLFQNRMNVLKIYDSPDLYYSGHPSYTSTSPVIIEEFGTESPNAGPSQYWWLVFNGGCSNASSVYTLSNGSTVSNWHEWKIRQLDASRSYNVYAYVPASYPTTTSAKYRLTRNGQVITTKTINQSANRGQWVSIGIISGSAGQSISCLLQDSTGEGVGSKKIGFDSCKFVPR